MKIHNKKKTVNQNIAELLVHACIPEPWRMRQEGCHKFKDNLPTSEFQVNLDCSGRPRLKQITFTGLVILCFRLSGERAVRSAECMFLYRILYQNSLYHMTLVPRGLFTDENEYNTLTVVIVSKRCLHFSSFRKPLLFPNVLCYPYKRTHCSYFN